MKDINLTGDEIALIKEALQQLKVKRELYGSETGKKRIEDLITKLDDA